MSATPWRLGLLGLFVSLGLAACQPQGQNEEGATKQEGDQITLACQGFEDQAACQQVVENCLDSGGTFESIALVNSTDQSMFNIVCRGPDATADPVPIPMPEAEASTPANAQP